ncbi:hypothetical protein [Silvanigrella sp.]|jgi:hypothetical protein|uniref:hypothetical protein n=1 Tax=Silvanigrella sp. TaxID=2024976 RepID=UPI0037C656F4
MLLKNSLISMVSFFLVSNAMAHEGHEHADNNKKEEQKVGVDFLINLENSAYSSFEMSELKVKYQDELRTAAIQGVALYSLNKSDYGSFVIGGGIDNYMLHYKNIVKLNNYESNAILNMFSLSVKASGGYKFTPAKRLDVYALANVGYGVFNSADLTSVTLNSSNEQKNTLTIDNHISYGVNGIAAYKFNETFSMGLGLGATVHSMNISNKKDLGLDQTINYVDVNSSLNLIFSI